MNDNKNLGNKLGKFTSNVIVVMASACLIALALGFASCVIVAILKVAALVVRWLIF